MKKNVQQQPDGSYVAFMVRMWRDSARSQWRASAQSVHTGEVVRFASVPMMLHYLHSHVAHGATKDDPELEAAATEVETEED